jgi:hypothetical protein
MREARDEVWVETSTTRASHVDCMGCLLEVIKACRANGRHTLNTGSVEIRS